MSITLQNHLNAVAPAMGMIGLSFEIHYDEGEEENFFESWALAFSELRGLDVRLIGYLLTKFEQGFEESVGKTIVLYAEDFEAEKKITEAVLKMELDVVPTGDLGIKHARGIDPHFLGYGTFTDLVVNELQDLGK